jgi:hypothetical protein
MKASAVQDGFDFVLGSSVDDLWVWGWHRVSSGDWVLWCSKEFDNIKDWMKSAHGIGEAQTVSILPYGAYDWVLRTGVIVSLTVEWW